MLEIVLGEKPLKQLVFVQVHHVIIVSLGGRYGEDCFGILSRTSSIVERYLAGVVFQSKVWMGLVQGKTDGFYDRGAQLQKVQRLADPSRMESVHVARTWDGQIQVQE